MNNDLKFWVAVGLVAFIAFTAIGPGYFANLWSKLRNTRKEIRNLFMPDR